MKTQSRVTTTLLAVLCGVLPSFAQTNNDTTDGNRQPTPNPFMTNGSTGVDDRDQRVNTSTGLGQNQRTNSWSDTNQESQVRFGRLEKADKIIGTEVQDSQGQKLGSVKDLAVSLKNGRVYEVIVARGGFLGVDQTYVAVPPSLFTCDAADKSLTLNVDKAKFDSARPFTLSGSDLEMDPAQLTRTYQYYGATPPSSTDNRPASQMDDTNSASRLGAVQRATKLMGLTARNNQDEKIGKVENLVVDLQSGRLVEVILATGGFLGIDQELSAVPPQSFSLGIHSDTLTLDRSQTQLSSSPHFKSTEWNTVTNQDQVESVYRSYNVPAYFDTNRADNTAQNSTDRDGTTLTPVSQGNSPQDIDTTRQIRQQIIATDNLSVNARNVKIITVDGKVTLRGPVNSEDEKRQIGEIAAKVASASNVDNELQVRNASTTSSAY